jgi:hypothetical protein
MYGSFNPIAGAMGYYRGAAPQLLRFPDCSIVLSGRILFLDAFQTLSCLANFRLCLWHEAGPAFAWSYGAAGGFVFGLRPDIIVSGYFPVVPPARSDPGMKIEGKNIKSPPDLSVEQGQMGNGSTSRSLSRTGIRRSPSRGLPDSRRHSPRQAEFRPRGRAVQSLFSY